MFSEVVEEEDYMPRDDMSPKELQDLWVDWAAMEQKKRLTQLSISELNSIGLSWDFTYKTLRWRRYIILPLTCDIGETAAPMPVRKKSLMPLLLRHGLER